MRRSLKTLSVLTLATLGTALSSASADAAGFYIQEQSVRAQGSAFSGSTTTLNDPSVIYYNPSGMTKIGGTQVQAGVHVISPSADLDDTGSTAPGGAPITSTGDGGNPYDPTPVPNFHASHQLNDQWWVGVSVSAPFGLENKYDDGWFGRYDSIETELTAIDVQPTVAYKMNDQLSFGAGLNIQRAEAKLTNAIFAGTEGQARLDGKDVSFGYTLGATWTPNDRTTVGASYRSAIGHTLDGDLLIQGSTGADTDVPGTADLNLPDIATLGLAYDVTNKITAQAQATWFGWSNFEDITTLVGGTQVNQIVQDYQNTFAFAVGLEYDHNDEWDFRAGVQFDETPTTDQFRTSRTPDGDRTWAAVGGTYTLNDRMDIDFAGTYIWIDDETINVTRNIPALPTTVSANTEGSVGILSVGLNYKF
jgi:long-chain fatty acid transport protein